ncbi:MAG: Hpt domain-containing protein [Candidatus Eremiobacterota bacterium]
MARLEHAALDRLMELGGAHFVADLLDTFLGDAPGRLQVATAAAGEGRWSEVERSVHSLASSAAMLGALDFSRRARAIEGRAAESPGPELVGELADLSDLYEVFRELMRKESLRLRSLPEGKRNR